MPRILCMAARPLGGGRATATRRPFDASSWKHCCARVSEQAYSILVPNGRTFGSQTFGLTLAESGAIVSIQYKAGNAASDVASAIDTWAKARPAQASDTDQIKAKADLIYQQRRLLTYQLTPPAM
jgi:hypothetical protein